MPKGGTIKLNTKAMHTNTAGKTIYNQGVEGRRMIVRKAAMGPASQTSQHAREEYRAHSWT